MNDARTLDLYQVDAFAERVFEGNPAAVCPLDAWLDARTLQAIAAENNLSETAFLVARAEGGYDLRWFTPRHEVELCGHATLASAFVVLRSLRPDDARVEFHTLSGVLVVEREDDGFVMDLPAVGAERVPHPPEALLQGLGEPPAEVWASDGKYMVVFEEESIVRGLRPDLARLETLHPRGVIVTAPGRTVDFVSRYFAPSYGIPEDPVTGSAHCVLVPYWGGRLGRKRLRARQVSARGGNVACEQVGTRVRLAGGAVLFLRGTIRLPVSAEGAASASGSRA